jgi:hypothetical protein
LKTLIAFKRRSHTARSNYAIKHRSTRGKRSKKVFTVTGDQGQTKRFGRIDMRVNNTVLALFGRLEETVREVRRCIRLRIANARKTGLVGSEPVLIPAQMIGGGVPLPAGLLVARLEERHEQIGYVALASVFGEVAVC